MGDKSVSGSKHLFRPIFGAVAGRSRCLRADLRRGKESARRAAFANNDRLSSSTAALCHAGIAVIPVVAASMMGQLATYPNLAPWYQNLAKPALNPPNWLFAPVWTALYAIMAYAVWRILRLAAGTPGRMTALALFFVQLVLDASLVMDVLRSERTRLLDF